MRRSRDRQARYGRFLARQMMELPTGMSTSRRSHDSRTSKADNAMFTGAIGTLISVALAAA